MSLSSAKATLLQWSEVRILIDGLETDRYTVARDYLFAMGDNRDDSLDSRYWGFVPVEDVIGTPMLVFWSWNPKIPLVPSRLENPFRQPFTHRHHHSLTADYHCRLPYQRLAAKKAFSIDPHSSSSIPDVTRILWFSTLVSAS